MRGRSCRRQETGDRRQETGDDRRRRQETFGGIDDCKLIVQLCAFLGSVGSFVRGLFSFS